METLIIGAEDISAEALSMARDAREGNITDYADKLSHIKAKVLELEQIIASMGGE